MSGTMRRAALVLLIALTWPGRGGAQSCCSPATTPNAAIEHAAPVAGSVNVGVYAEHLSLSGLKRGRQSIPDPGQRHSNAQSISLAVHAGLVGPLAVGVVVPMSRREQSDLVVGGQRLARDHGGLGDISILGYWNLLSRLSRREWTIGGGIKLGTGASRAEDVSGELPQTLQPGTGSNDGVLTTRYTQGVGPLSLSGGVTWRSTGSLTKVDADPSSGTETRRVYRFGNELAYSVSAGWTPDARWGLELGVRGQHAEPDEATRLEPDGTTGPVESLPRTGSERLWLVPSLRAVSTNRTSVQAGILIPIYENVRGSQLASGLGFLFSVTGAY